VVLMPPPDPTPEDLAYVRTVFDGLAEALVRFGRPMPATVSRARGILDRTLTWSMSLQRQVIGPDEEESDFGCMDLPLTASADQLAHGKRHIGVGTGLAGSSAALARGGVVDSSSVSR
jgi:hypothetical protein